MEEIIVSFCITTFQRYKILEELVLNILSVDNHQFEIVVCDDCSADNSLNKLKNIHDERLNIYVNDKRIGALQNMYQALEHGKGKYLFFVNDRDNVDSFKIQKLITILEEFNNKNVAFAKCTKEMNLKPEYKLFLSGSQAFFEFACRIAHPTGYIFRRDVWRKIRNRKSLFYKEGYGDYPITLICAIMALRYNGAVVFGDICDVENPRIDFAKEKSQYHWKRKDKRMWYSPGVHWRELQILYRVLKKMNVEEKLIEDMIYVRYKEYLGRVTLQYKEIVSSDSDTTHYNIDIPQNIIIIYINAIKNGLYLWWKVRGLCRYEKKSVLLNEINNCTKENFCMYFNSLYEKILKLL